MKTKNLYVLAIGFFSLLTIVFVGIIPFLMCNHYPWVAVSIFLFFVIIGIILYMTNIPGYKMHKLYEDEEIKQFKRFQGLQYKYYPAKYSYACGPSIIQTILDKYGITITQDEIMKSAGDMRFGMTPWEIEYTLNDLFRRHNKPFIARMQWYTTYMQLFNAVHKGMEVIVLFINQFCEPEFPKIASYPHFALVSYIKINQDQKKNKVVLLSPSFSGINPYFKAGKYKGEVEMSIEEFQGRFYMSQKHLNRLRYKPTQTRNVLLNNWNRILNILFIFAFYVGYCTKILKPGLAIFVHKKNNN